MEKEKIQSFLQTNAKYLPSNEINTITSLLKIIEDEDKIYSLHSIQFKNPNTYTLLYWLCPGFALIDRFLIGSIILGILKLPIIYMILWEKMTKAYQYEDNPFENPLIAEASANSFSLLLDSMAILVGLYILWILIDGFTIKARVKKYNLAKLDKIILD